MTCHINHEGSHCLKTLAIIFGLIMLAVGVLGFIPAALKDGNLLFGLFRVNTGHNIIHLVTGVIALLCGLNSVFASRLFFQIFGVIYGLITLLGLYYLDRDMFGGLVAHNTHDVWLHAIISIIALILGFGCCRRKCHPCESDEHHLQNGSKKDYLEK